MVAGKVATDSAGLQLSTSVTFETVTRTREGGGGILNFGETSYIQVRTEVRKENDIGPECARRAGAQPLSTNSATFCTACRFDMGGENADLLLTFTDITSHLLGRV